MGKWKRDRRKDAARPLESRPDPTGSTGRLSVYGRGGRDPRFIGPAPRRRGWLGRLLARIGRLWA